MSRGAMLAQQEWQDANRKRGREDDYQDIAAGGTLGFTEHRSVSKDQPVENEKHLPTT
jgi:hypothetical protein